ncbi:MAG: ATP-binding protein [Pseudomonadota bacterium]
MTSVSHSSQEAPLSGVASDSTLLASLFNALPQAVLAVDGENRVIFANQAAELFFQSSLTLRNGSALSDHLPKDSAIFSLIHQARERRQSIREHQVILETPKIGLQEVSIDAAPLDAPAAGEGLPLEQSSAVVLAFRQGSIARRIDQQLVHRNAARSVSAMAALLAHEVKNPLSGIRGAAQLLERDCPAGSRDLTRLICDEADRIVALLDDMEMFSDARPLARDGVNIHEVLDDVARLLAAGAGEGIRFVKLYDPSLPLVHGHRDLLIQAFLNLMKNAVEALSGEGEILLTTQYLQGYRLAVNGAQPGQELPLMVSVKDNGPGISESLRDHLFDPFITSKTKGKGLGLALVAKVVGDHGGVIEFESQPGQTEFRVQLPMVPRGLQSSSADVGEAV